MAALRGRKGVITSGKVSNKKGMKKYRAGSNSLQENQKRRSARSGKKIKVIRTKPHGNYHSVHYAWGQFRRQEAPSPFIDQMGTRKNAGSGKRTNLG